MAKAWLPILGGAGGVVTGQWRHVPAMVVGWAAMGWCVGERIRKEKKKEFHKLGFTIDGYNLIHSRLFSNLLLADLAFILWWAQKPSFVHHPHRRRTLKLHIVLTHLMSSPQKSLVAHAQPSLSFYFMVKITYLIVFITPRYKLICCLIT